MGFASLGFAPPGGKTLKLRQQIDGCQPEISFPEVHPELPVT